MGSLTFSLMWFQNGLTWLFYTVWLMSEHGKLDRLHMRLNSSHLSPKLDRIYLQSWPEPKHWFPFFGLLRKIYLREFFAADTYQSKSWRWRQRHSGWLFIKWGDDALSKCDGSHKSHKHNWINKKNLFYDDRHPIQWIKYARTNSFGFRTIVPVVFF